jgi:hypothetical protein
VKKPVSKFAFQMQPAALHIGPRGNTQKRMQRETNTKIAIRGKGGALYKFNPVYSTHSLKVPGLVSTLEPIE